jgi:hypothetical protein
VKVRSRLVGRSRQSRRDDIEDEEIHLSTSGHCAPRRRGSGRGPAFEGLDYSIGRLKTGHYRSLRTAWRPVFRTIYHHTPLTACARI